MVNEIYIRDDIFNDLPKFTIELVDHLGWFVTRCVCRCYGGQGLYVPRRPTAKFMRGFQDSVRIEICKHYGSSEIRIPLLKSMIRAERNENIMQDYEDKLLKPNDIAQKFNISIDIVCDVINKYNKPQVIASARVGPHTLN